MAGLRIALFTRATPAHHPAGGMERHADQLARGLARRGHAVTVFSTALAPGAPPDAGEPGLAFRYLAGTRPGVYRGGYWARSRAAFAAAQVAAPFDLIVSQSAGAWGALALPAAARPPCLAILHGSPGGELSSAWRARPLSPKTWAKTALAPAQWARDRRRLPRCAALVAVSQAVAGSLAREYGAAAGAPRVIPNGVATEGLRAADPGASRLLLYAGRVIAEKGVFLLIEAFAAVAATEPAARLRVVGGGALAALRARAAELGLAGRVEICGPVPHAAMGEHYAAAALLVLPTLREEGLPLSVLEAMAAGLPVLAAARGGLGEALRDGVEGRLLERVEPAGLAAALSALLADPAERARLGAAARQRALAVFSERAMLDAYEECLLGLAAGAASRAAAPAAAGAGLAGGVACRRVDFLAWRDASNASARCRGLAYAGPLAARGWDWRFLPPSGSRLARALNPRGGFLRAPAKLLYLAVSLAARLRQLAGARRAAVLVVQRELLSLGPPLLEGWFARRHPCLVYDVDDALDLGAPHLRPLGGALRSRGKSRRLAAMSRCVVASNAVLAGELGELGVPVRVIPTPVDLERFPPPTPEPGGPLRLGWFGTGGNLYYLEQIAPALRRVQAETGCELLVVSEWDFRMPDLAVINRRWSLAEEPALLLGCHVGLMPLADTAYARAKAGFKILQHWAAARPVVASPVGFNAQLVADGEDGVLAAGEEDWVRALLSLAADAELRARLGRAGRAKVERDYSLSGAAERWAALLAELAGGALWQP